MSVIIKNDDYRIIKDSKNDYTYILYFSPFGDTKELINSITKTKLMIGTTITSDDKIMSFKATSVKTLEEYKVELKKKYKHSNLPYPKVLKMTKDLIIQLEYLINRTKHTFIGYNQKNVIVIDDNKFIYLSLEHLHEISKDGLINMTCPFTNDDFFLSPEIKEIKYLPSKVNYKTSYYSLASLLIYGLTNDDTILYYKNEEEEEDILKYLSIKETQLEWFLERCLITDPNKRSMIFI